MKDLKTIMFEDVYEKAEAVKGMQALFGEADSMTTRAIAKFTTLCDLLDRAGLVEEYNEWRRHCYNAGY